LSEKDVPIYIYWLHFYGEQAGLYMQLIYKDAFAVMNLDTPPTHTIKDVLNTLPYSDLQSLIS